MSDSVGGAETFSTIRGSEVKLELDLFTIDFVDRRHSHAYISVS